MQPRRRSAVMLAWRALPAFTLVVLLLIPHILGLQGGRLGEILPPLPLLALLYWGMEHPRRLGWQPILIVGLLNDALLAYPPGLTVLIWCLFRWLVLIGRRDVREQGFIVAWAFGALALLAALFALWFSLSLYAGRVFPLGPSLLQWCVAVLLYPSVHTLLHDIEKRFHKRYWFVLKAG